MKIIIYKNDIINLLEIWGCLYEKDYLHIITDNEYESYVSLF